MGALSPDLLPRLDASFGCSSRVDHPSCPFPSRAANDSLFRKGAMAADEWAPHGMGASRSYGRDREIPSKLGRANSGQRITGLARAIPSTWSFSSNYLTDL